MNEPTKNILGEVWVNGAKKIGAIEYCSSAVVSSGQATFYLTDDGTSIGNAVFTNIFTEGCNFLVEDADNVYNFSGISISGDKKSITVDINKLSISVGVVTFINAANGVTIYARIIGN